MGIVEKAKSYLTETQIGEVAVNLVSNMLIMHSGGRLSPFKPVADDGGIDLLIYDKKTHNSIPCQVKSRTKTLNRNKNNVHFEVRKASYKGSTYLIAVLLDWEKHEISKSWLIPPEAFPHNERNKYVFVPNISESSKDRYRQHRSDTMKELVQAVLKRLG